MGYMQQAPLSSMPQSCSSFFLEISFFHQMLALNVENSLHLNSERQFYLKFNISSLLFYLIFLWIHMFQSNKLQMWNIKLLFILAFNCSQSFNLSQIKIESDKIIREGYRKFILKSFSLR